MLSPTYNENVSQWVVLNAFQFEGEIFLCLFFGSLIDGMKVIAAKHIEEGDLTLLVLLGDCSF